MEKILSICLFLISFSSISANDGYLRNIYADVLHYEFNLVLNDSTDRVEGRSAIKVRFLDDADSMTFDFKDLDVNGRGMSVKSVAIDNESVKWRHGDGKLVVLLSKRVILDDTLVFVIEYNGIPADGLVISKNKFGKRTFFADHWPDRAHNYLPCIDHPYDKASVDFIITAPDRYKIIASGILIEESDLPGPSSLTHWSEELPLATKVMTFGAAEFAVSLSGSVNKVAVWSWVYPENRMEGFHDYSIAVKPMEYFSTIIGPYPYGKLANVQSKTIFGGLENAGTIFYSENSVTGNGKADGLIAHEIAHQWFGDCVTEDDWHHIWLSEGFATYLTSLYFESVYGRSRLETDMRSSRTRVLRYFDRNPKPVIDTTVSNLMELLNANSYQKGGWVLHMLRNEVGDKSFFNGLSLFFTRFQNSNALTEDFMNVMEEVSAKSLSRFFFQWLYLPGQPELQIWHEAGEKKGTTRIFIEQKQADLFEFTIQLLLRDSSGERIENVAVKDKVTEIEIKTDKLQEIIPDPFANLLFRQDFN